MSKKVLIVEDDPNQAENLSIYLERHGWQTWICGDAQGALAVAADVSPAAILIDQSLPDMLGTELTELLMRRFPQTRVIMLTGDDNAKTIVNAFRAGAADYLVKPAALAEVLARLDHLVETTPETRRPEVPGKKPARQGMVEILGESEAVQSLRTMLQQLVDAESRMAASDLPAVLVQGETGTGKELVARAIHHCGSRQQGPFVEVNCAAIPSHLLEAELFGHERGAFTDAKERKTGLVEAADGGTLFLDEIGEIDLSVQAKLLKLLEEKTIRRLGSVREQAINLRIVTATNRDLEQMVKEGRFRADLFFRLRIIRIAVPPLRQRGNDILLLARHFLREHGRRYGKPNLRFSEAAETILMTYSWPGNVRELKNMLEQTVLLSPDDCIQPEQITICSHLTGTTASAASASSAASVPGTLVERPVHSPATATADWSMRASRHTAEHDQRALLDILSRTDWNVTKTARLLGMSRDMLRYRIDKLGLTRETDHA